MAAPTASWADLTSRLNALLARLSNVRTAAGDTQLHMACNEWSNAATATAEAAAAAAPEGAVRERLVR